MYLIPEMQYLRALHVPCSLLKNLACTAAAQGHERPCKK
jgi:hypothetical protein